MSGPLGAEPAAVLSSRALSLAGPSKVGTRAAATDVARLLYGASMASCIIPKSHHFSY